jgi:1-phosphofructokinase
MPQTIYMDIMKFLEGRGIGIVVDATRDLLVNVLKYRPFLIKPNNHELGEIFGIEITDKDDVVKYAKKLQDKGARNVLVSMAGDGAVLVAEDGSEYRSEAPKGKVVNSVGAGDSMVAGFIAGYFENHDYGKAFMMGVCTGSASAFSEELATRDEVQELMKSKAYT